MVAQVLSGMLLLLTGMLGVMAARGGRAFRQPTPPQLEAVTLPVSRIATRHLPLDALGPDLADATAAAVAVHSYVMDGALVTQAKPAPLAPDTEEPRA